MNSITKHLDETDLITSIRLQLRHPSNDKKIWIIVEGETDQKLFAKLMSGRNALNYLIHRTKWKFFSFLLTNFFVSG